MSQQQDSFQNFFSGQIQRDRSQNSSNSRSMNNSKSKDKLYSNIRVQYKKVNPQMNTKSNEQQYRSQRQITNRPLLIDNFQKNLDLIQEKQNETLSNDSSQQNKMSSFNIASEISLEKPKIPSIIQKNIQYTTSITTDQRQFVNNHSFKRDKQIGSLQHLDKNNNDEEINKQKIQPKFSKKIMQQLSDKKSNKSFKEEFFQNEIHDNDIIQLMKIQNGKLILNNKALEYIESIKQKICVLSVIGPYRSGKSFLLNRFQNQQKGFALGNTTNPCTEGVWFWGVKNYKQDKVILLIDTEGLFAFNRDEQQDIKLFLFTAMISSMMIYNTFGVIDESSLERLDFITRLGSYFGFVDNKKLLKEKELSYYFPHLIWLLRDFTLELKDNNIQITSSEYLERILNLKQHNENDDIIKNINESVLQQSNFQDQNNLRQSKKLKQDQQNNIRKQIKNIFQKRTCKTLVRPVFDERKLRNIDKISYDELRNEFIDQLQDLQDYVFMNIEEKKVKQKSINGQLFVEYIKMIANALNQNKIPEMKTIWKQIEEFQLKNIHKQIEIIIQQKLDGVQTQLPLKNSQIVQYVMQTKQDTFYYLLQQNLDSYLVQRVLENSQRQFDNLMLQINNINRELKNEKIQENLLYIQQVFEDQSENNYNWQIYEDTIMNYVNKNFDSNRKAIAIRKIFQMLFQKFDSQYKQQSLQSQDQEIKISKLQGQYQATKSLLEQQKKVIEGVISQTQLTQQKSMENFENQLQEQRQNYQIKIMELEDRLQQQDNGQNFQKNSTIQTFKETQNYVEIKSMLGQIMQNIQQQQNTIQKSTNKSNIDTEKFKEYFDQIRIENKTEIDEMKTQNQNENQKIKKQNEDLKKILNESKLLLLKKDSEIKILQEKIRSENKYRNTQMEFSDTLCNISDQIMNLLKKMESKIQKQLIQFTILMNTGSRSYRHRFQSQGSIDKDSSGFSRLIRRLKRNKINVKNITKDKKKQRVKKEKLKQQTTPYYQSFLETSKIIKAKSRSTSKSKKTKIISQRQSRNKTNSKEKRKDNQRMTVNQNKKYHSSSKSQNSITYKRKQIQKIYHNITPLEQQLKSNERRIIHLTKSLSQRNFSNQARILQIKKQITRKRSKKQSTSSKKKKQQSKPKKLEYIFGQKKSIFQKKKSQPNLKNKIKEKKVLTKIDFHPFLQILKTFENIINHFKELNNNLSFEIYRDYLIGNFPFLIADLFNNFEPKKKKKLQQTYAKEMILFSYGFNFLKKYNDCFQQLKTSQKEILKSQFYDEKNKNNDTNSKAQILQLYFVALSRISLIIEKVQCSKNNKTVKVQIQQKIIEAEKNYGIQILNQEYSKKIQQMESIIKDLMNMMGQLLLFFQTQQKDSIKEFSMSFKQKVQDIKKLNSNKINIKDWQQLLDYFEVVFSQQEIMMFDIDHMNQLLNFDMYFNMEDQQESNWINLIGPFLPPIDPKYKYTLVVDLDETLIYFPDNKMENFEEEVQKSLLIRPYALKFIENLSKFFEIIIFTAATQDYADLILDQIDTNKIIQHRLYQQHISMIDNLPVKDLSQLGRDLSKLIIIEDTPSNYSLQKDNGLHVKQWKGDMNDQCFLWLELVLTTLAQQQPDDIRTLLKGVKETLVAEQLINFYLQQ